MKKQILVLLALTISFSLFAETIFLEDISWHHLGVRCVEATVDQDIDQKRFAIEYDLKITLNNHDSENFILAQENVTSSRNLENCLVEIEVYRKKIDHIIKEISDFLDRVIYAQKRGLYNLETGLYYQVALTLEETTTRSSIVKAEFSRYEMGLVRVLKNAEGLEVIDHDLFEISFAEKDFQIVVPQKPSSLFWN